MSLNLQTITVAEKDPFRVATAIRQIIEVLNTSGLVTAHSGQLSFPATQNPSSDANTLDDYEEGSWTPVLTFATPGDLSVTYSQQTGQYIKIGRLITAWFNVDTSAFTHATAAGDLRLTGLPYAADAFGGNSFRGGGLLFEGITKANYTQIVPQVTTAATTVFFGASGSGQVRSTVTATDTPSGGNLDLRGSVVYLAGA